MEDNYSISNADDELKSLAPVLAGIPKQHGFAVPEGYFIQLPEKVEDAILLAGTSLAALPKKNPFEIPGNYFQGLPLAIENQLIPETRFLNQLPKETGFTLPDDYFIRLSQEITTRITLENSHTQHPFQLPEGYFEELPHIIQEKINETNSTTNKGGKVVSLFRDQLVMPAIAAGIAVLITIGGIIKLTETPSSVVSPAQPTLVQSVASSDETIAVSVEIEQAPDALENTIVAQIDEHTIIEAIPDYALAMNTSESSTELSEDDIRNFTADDVGNYLFNETMLSSLVNGI